MISIFQGILMIIDSKAEALENAVLYRRTNDRWLAVFDHRMCEKEREWIRLRRNACLRKIPKPRLVVEYFSHFRRAADETQKNANRSRSNSCRKKKSGENLMVRIPNLVF